MKNTFLSRGGKQSCPFSETLQAADSCATPCPTVRAPAADTHSVGGLWLPDRSEVGQPYEGQYHVCEPQFLHLASGNNALC